MNAVKTMKNIASIQLVIAFGSCLIFILPSLYSFLTIYLILPMLGIWWIGIRLMIGYDNISQGKSSILQTRGFWFGSLIFNALGVGIGLWILKDGWGSEYIFSCVPGLVSIILATIALLVPAENTNNLEPSSF